MRKNSLSTIEKIHLGIQITAQVTTIITAIVIGLWGYYTMVYVKKEKEVTEYTLKELDQKTTQEPHIQASIESTVQPIENGFNLLQIKVVLSNLGSKESKIPLDDAALTLVPVDFSEGTPVYQKPISLMSGRYTGTLHRQVLPFINIGAGESYELTFVHSLKKSGTFLIHFLALNGTSPSGDESFLTEALPYQDSVGADQYIIIK
ncbi:TPA: hypothetical protein RM991_000469 [Escherichia coli]|nr:hypothetical protein [Escherichia coli]HDW8582294.1 hypothetical protein [Escherichia coli]HDW8587065.1 hypothetical protein [Escherichia coli]